jgi:hypothetical protein
MIDEAKAKGCTKVLLNATKMGRPLYEKFGFCDIDDEMVYYIK